MRHLDLSRCLAVAIFNQRQLLDEGNIIFAKFKFVTAETRSTAIFYEYMNHVDAEMLRPPNPISKDFEFSCFHENGRTFSERIRETNSGNGLKRLQMFDEMAKCWKCRYLLLQLRYLFLIDSKNVYFTSKYSSDWDTKSDSEWFYFMINICLWECNSINFTFRIISEPTINM